VETGLTSEVLARLDSIVRSGDHQTLNPKQIFEQISHEFNIEITKSMKDVMRSEIQRILTDVVSAQAAAAGEAQDDQEVLFFLCVQV
jgi:hypothetical protein